VSALSVAEGYAQIDALVGSVDLPTRALPQHYVDMIISRLVDAWATVKTSQPTYALTSDEASLNGFMVSALTGILADDPVFGLLVSSVRRGSETHNFDGTYIEKRPDIQFNTTDRGSPFAIIVECKIIDGGSRTVGKYCTNGVARFVDGTYGWAQPEGFMLAYVRDKSSLGTKLAAYLKTGHHGTTAFSQPHLATPDRTFSRHDRAFAYPTKTAPKNVPGAVQLWHIWLQ
jgi:hypothetical protein